MAVTNTVVPELAACELGRKAMIEVLARVGDKWTILIVAALSGGPMRYGQLQRHICDISQRMLTLTLKGLTEDGLVRRTAYPTPGLGLEEHARYCGFETACSKDSYITQSIPR